MGFIAIIGFFYVANTENENLPIKWEEGDWRATWLPIAWLCGWLGLMYLFIYLFTEVFV